MDKHDYECPVCKGTDISFLRIENVGRGKKEETIFFCRFCDEEFCIKGLRPEYLPSLVAILKEKYPS